MERIRFFNIIFYTYFLDITLSVYHCRPTDSQSYLLYSSSHLYMHFHSKCLDNFLLMTSCLVTIVTDNTKLVSKCGRGKTNNYWKRQVLMSVRLGKKLRKTSCRGECATLAPLVRPRVKLNGMHLVNSKLPHLKWQLASVLFHDVSAIVVGWWTSMGICKPPLYLSARFFKLP